MHWYFQRWLKYVLSSGSDNSCGIKNINSTLLSLTNGSGCGILSGGRLRSVVVAVILVVQIRVSTLADFCL